MKLLFAVVAALSTAPALAAEDVLAEDNHGITLAVMQGNTETLERIGKAKGAERFLGRAAYYRARGDLDKSNQWADTCLANAGVQAQKGQGIHYLCRSLRAGNRLLQGDVSGWATEMVKVRALYEEHIAPSLSKGEVAAITQPRFERFVSTPAFGEQQGQRVVGARIPVSDRAGVPIVRGKIQGGNDGKKRDIDADLILDTGSTRSHISRKTAQAMGLTIVEDFAVGTTDQAHPLRIGLAAPVDVQIGDLLFRNVSFTVTDSIDFILIGLDVLSGFGPMVIRQDHLELLESVPTHTCTQPARFTSALWGNQNSLRLPMRIGDRDTLVLMDTGASTPLEVTGFDMSKYPNAKVEVQRRITASGNNMVRVAEATAPVTFNGATVTLPSQAADLPPRVFPVAWSVGYGLRKDYDYYIDVRGGRGCLAAKAPTQPSL